MARKAQDKRGFGLKSLDDLWQIIRNMQEDLFKKTNPDIPKRWNCCDMLVSPRDLAQHVKDYHMNDYRWTDSDRIEVISIVWILANFIAILILQ